MEVCLVEMVIAEKQPCPFDGSYIANKVLNKIEPFLVICIIEYESRWEDMRVLEVLRRIRNDFHLQILNRLIE